MQIKIIAALDENNGIGKENKLPWSNKDDMRFFSRNTTGGGNNAILMGRNTYESIGKVLPNRTNIVVSTTLKNPPAHPHLQIVNTLDDGINRAKIMNIDILWIIGGASIYKSMINDYRHLIDECVLSSIPGNYDCDTFFPSLDSQWRQAYTFYIGDNMLKVTHWRNLNKNIRPVINNNNSKAAFITGITGQDGSYLAELLISKGYDVFGIVRRTSGLYHYTRIDHIRQYLHLDYGDLSDNTCMTRIIERIIDTGKYSVLEVYNLAAQSHVGISFELPEYTTDIDGTGVLRLLEIIKSVSERTSCKIKFYQAGTSEMFGDVNNNERQTLDTSFNPVSPYAAAKLYAFYITKMYRNAYNLYAVNGILFNHESPRRGENFVTMKIINAVKDIISGKRESISLGNLSSRRDWGHAEDYVRGMWLMMQQEGIPDDYLLATGETRSVKEFAEIAFSKVGLNITWKGAGLQEKGVDQNNITCITIYPKYFRPNEERFLLGDPSKAENELGWTREYDFPKLITDMLTAK